MAAHAARRLRPMAANALGIVAIELLTAAQGCDFHAPLKSSRALERAARRLRAACPTLAEDRYLHADLQAANAHVGAARCSRQRTTLPCRAA
jgi:histidine ammonia-lyase